MRYFLSFLEGIITFISPCMLPMLPIYVSYFVGQDDLEKKSNTFINALGFVLGFTLIFLVLGAFAGALGGLLLQYSKLVNLIAGSVMIIFGLNYLQILNVPFLNSVRKFNIKINQLNFLKSLLFGIVFSIGWSPCIGVFLGSALMLAASQGQCFTGIIMLLCYSLGLGIPFIISALLLEQLKTTLAFIKHNYRIINILSGSLLVVLGLLMATGLLGHYLALLSL